VDSGGSENGVGIYTYTASGVETAQVATTFTAPPMTVSNSGGDVITLSFTNATSGTWTNLNTNSGSFTLSDASSTAPDSLSGLRLQNANTGSNVYQFTNEIGDGIYTSTDSNGVSSGTYTYSQYSPVLGLFQTIPTNAGNLGMTNYVLLNFVPGSNTYYVETDATNGTDTNSGSFNVSGEATTAYVGPVSLAGLTAAVSEVKPGGARKSWTLSFDASMFGKFALNTNVDSGVGTYTFTRTGPKTALYANDFMAPPQSTNSDGGSEITFYFTGSHSAIVTNSGGRATVTFSEPAGIVPLSLAGKTFTGSAPDHHASGGVSFGNGTFAGVGDLTGVGGNYTYTPFGPQAAMAVLTFTVGNGSGTAAGSTWYIEMWFSSATSGSDINNDFGPDGTLDKVSTGTFTVK
jgi:hypothetical protein